MKTFLIGLVVVVYASLLATLFIGQIGIGVNNFPELRIDGSSTVYPLMEAAAEAVLKEMPDIRVAVGVSGTGGGLKRFCRGEIDLAQASREMKSQEANDCKIRGINFKQETVALDAIAIVVNRDNDWAYELTLDELKSLWQPAPRYKAHKIKNWRDIRSNWPDTPINLFGPGIDSGTFDFFTKVVVGTAGATRSDFTSSEDDNLIVSAVSRNKYALGYLGYSYYFAQRDKLRAVAIEQKILEQKIVEQNTIEQKSIAGVVKSQANSFVQDPRPPIKKFVLPSYESVASGDYAPLTRPLFIYYQTSQKDPISQGGNPKKLKIVDRFMTFIRANRNRLATEVGLLPLQNSLVPSP